MSVVMAPEAPVEVATAIDCRNVSKVFYERLKGTRSFRNFFLGKRIKLHAVDNVSLQIKRNEIFGLLGANGSGKSTLIRMFATLLLPDKGELKVFDYDVDKQRLAVRRLINRVSVEASFFKQLSALENIRYAARLYGLSGKEADRKALAILDSLGIPAQKTSIPVSDLSRGMQQKVSIARAFITSPTLILLDEPTTGLDPNSRIQVQEYIRHIMSTHDATILLATHDMYEAEKLCDRIAIIDDGKILAVDTAEELKKMAGAETLEDVFLTMTGRSLMGGWTDEECT